jgi:hypothetical protein
MFNDLGARLPRLVALREAWTRLFQLIRWVDLRRSMSTWRILKNMILFLLQIDRKGVDPVAECSELL